MKKLVPEFLAIALVASFAKIAAQVQAVTSPTEVAQVPNALAKGTIPVVLPATVNLVLKNQSSMTGQLTAFDAKGQTLEISHGRDSRTVGIAQVQKLNFWREALVYDSIGKIVIRGDDPAMARQRTWPNIPLQAFELKDPKLGQAQVTLTGVLTPTQLDGIQKVVTKSLYVLDEIQFQPAGKMTIKVVPTDRPFRS